MTAPSRVSASRRSPPGGFEFDVGFLLSGVAQREVARRRSQGADWWQRRLHPSTSHVARGPGELGRPRRTHPVRKTPLPPRICRPHAARSPGSGQSLRCLSLFAEGRRRGTLGGLADGAAIVRGCGKPVAGPDPLRRQTLVCRDWCPRRLARACAEGPTRSNLTAAFALASSPNRRPWLTSCTGPWPGRSRERGRGTGPPGPAGRGRPAPRG